MSFFGTARIRKTFRIILVLPIELAVALLQTKIRPKQCRYHVCLQKSSHVNGFWRPNIGPNPFPKSTQFSDQFWCVLGAHYGSFGSPLDPPKSSLDPFRAPLGALWAPCGPLWAPSGNPGGPNIAPGLHFGRFGVPFWLIWDLCLSISDVFWCMLASFQSLALVSHNSRPCSTTYSPDPKNSLGRTSLLGIHSSLFRTP